jgi:hypothetical protein
MTKIASLLTIFAFLGINAYAAEPIKGINCGGESLATLGAKLAISLVKEGGDSYKVLLTRKSKDGSIDIENKVVATGLTCRFHDLARVQILAECVGGSRKNYQRFSVTHSTFSSVDGDTSFLDVTVQSPAIKEIAAARADINKIFGHGDLADQVISARLGGPAFTCERVQ